MTTSKDLIKKFHDFSTNLYDEQTSNIIFSILSNILHEKLSENNSCLTSKEMNKLKDVYIKALARIDNETEIEKYWQKIFKKDDYSYIKPNDYFEMILDKLSEKVQLSLGNFKNDKELECKILLEKIAIRFKKLYPADKTLLLDLIENNFKEKKSTWVKLNRPIEIEQCKHKIFLHLSLKNPHRLFAKIPKKVEETLLRCNKANQKTNKTYLPKNMTLMLCAHTALSNYKYVDQADVDRLVRKMKSWK